MHLFQGKGIFLTARGQDINRQPNILYITTDHGRSWTALHEFVNVRLIYIISLHKNCWLYFTTLMHWILCIFSRNVNVTTKTSMISWFINWTCTKRSATYVSLLKMYLSVVNIIIFDFILIHCNCFVYFSVREGTTIL